ncbi:MAG: HlyC/CorC family transporter [Chloroflexi bacterium]|nr:HlyC/CorC family transporter [Chloroflexota bacterium]
MGIVWLDFVLIVVLMLANGFFAASEIAVVSARRGRLQQRAEEGNKGAQTALNLANEPNRFLATVQVGITLIGTFAAAFGGDALAEPLGAALEPSVGRYAHSVALVLVVLLITYLSLILGELVPKRLALQHAETMASRVAPIMRQISRLSAPVVWFLTTSTEVVLRLLGQHRQEAEQVTEEDVLSLVREGTEGGSLEASERDLIERVFDFTDSNARSIMTPRTEIFAVPFDLPFDQIVARVIESEYSRIPVYQGSIDRIQGVLYTKDLLRATQSGPSPRLEDLLRPPVFVLEHQRISAVLQQIKQTRTHLALVLDEYGQIEGLITLEDVLEEIMGDIADEYDEVDTMVVRRADGSMLVEGMISYSDAEHQIGLPPRDQLNPEGTRLPPFDTLAGLLLALFERIPVAGDVVTLGEWRFEVVDMDGVRIDKVLVQQTPPPSDREQSEAALALRAVLPASTQLPEDQPNDRE